MSILLHLYTRNILSQLLCVILQCTLMLGRGVNVNSITLQTEKKRGGKEDAVDSNKTYPLLGAQ